MLSIQSHTVSGYVGNRCSVFTLQVPCALPPLLSHPNLKVDQLLMFHRPHQLS